MSDPHRTGYLEQNLTTLRASPSHPPPRRTAPAIDLSQLCTDLSVNCRDWAAKGECEKNQPFMVGTEVQPGQCRESCGTCPYPKLTGGAAKAPQPKVMSESIVRGGADKD